MLPWLMRGTPGPLARTALSCRPSLEEAVREVCSGLADAGEADLALVFASSSYASDLPRLLPLLRRQLRARCWLGAVGGGVVGTDRDGNAREVEQLPGLSVSLLRLPGAELTPFRLSSGELPDLDGPHAAWGEALGLDPERLTGMVLLVDPGFAGINDLLAGLDYGFPGITKVGGLAGIHSAPHDSLLWDQEVCGGAVGVAFGGAWAIEPVVAQGCRPIGPVFEVEQAQRNVLLELRQGDQVNSPILALQGVIEELNPQDRELIRRALFVGLARSSFSLRTTGETPPFLVRNLMGIDPRNGAMAIGDQLRVGQRLQFQLRDGDTSRQELRQLLDQRARQGEAPLMGLLFACLGRGRSLYGSADVDVTVCRAVHPSLPVAGLFCNGEIGPVAGSTQLHGYTASWGFVVPRTA